MKTLLLLIAMAVPAFAQGPLAPPATATPQTGPTAPLDGGGHPQPAMKTLYQVEPRTAVQTLAATPPYTITQPGSYYLTDNITVATGDAIDINADGVTLDLNGFSLTSAAATPVGTAVNFLGKHSQITILHGSISGTATISNAGTVGGGGFNGGITGSYVLAQFLISDIHFKGIGGACINLEGGVIERCTAVSCGAGFIAAEIHECSVESCSGVAIDAYVSASNCLGHSVTYHGILCGGDTLNCVGLTDATTTSGIQAEGNAENCTGISPSGGYGLHCGGNAKNCIGSSVAGIGLYAAGNAEGCKGDSDAYVSGAYGLRVDGNAANCTGTSIVSEGISVGGNAMNCTGTSTSAAGISATGNVMNCSGTSHSGAGIITGVDVEGGFVGSVTNSTGISTSGAGIVTYNAANSVGRTSGTTSAAVAIRCLGTANCCTAVATGGGTSLSLNAAIAIGCTVSGATSIPAGKSFNM